MTKGRKSWFQLPLSTCLLLVAGTGLIMYENFEAGGSFAEGCVVCDGNGDEDYSHSGSSYGWPFLAFEHIEESTRDDLGKVRVRLKMLYLNIMVWTVFLTSVAIVSKFLIRHRKPRQKLRA